MNKRTPEPEKRPSDRARERSERFFEWLLEGQQGTPPVNPRH